MRYLPDRSAQVFSLDFDMIILDLIIVVLPLSAAPFP
jgi:hypothetical protein